MYVYSCVVLCLGDIVEPRLSHCELEIFFNCTRQLAESHIAISQACAVIQSVACEDHHEGLTSMKWLWEFVTRAW